MKRNIRLILCLILILTSLMNSCSLISREPKIFELNVTVNGNDCIYEGPDEFKAGPVILTFYNENDTESVFEFAYFDEGKITQEFIDYFNDPDSGHWPSWANEYNYANARLHAGETKAFEFELDPGLYTFICAQNDPIEIYLIDGFVVR